jgi:hypothetical protein
MSTRLSYSNQVSSKAQSSRSDIKVGVVLDVIKDDSHTSIYDLGLGNEGETRNTNTIGSVKIRKVDDISSPVDALKFYPPLDYNSIDLPIVGEMVEIVTNESGKKYYRRITSSNLNTGNVLVNPDGAIVPITEKSSGDKSSDYKSTSQTGTPNSSQNENDTFENEYFEPSQVNHLVLYEGDKLLQTRFGQSIRFSGFNNENNVFAPTIIIRNRQGDKSLENLDRGTPTEENFVDDGSTIAMTSGDYELGFTPGTVDTPLETTPVYTEEPELKGTDQILINSGRIVISSKDAEMMFYSKGNYSFVSDGKLTIDNGNDGAEMDFNGEVRMTTNSNNIYLLGDSGEIYLNTEETTEPLVRGETLKGLLEELIDAINQQVFMTPSGPTAVGPTNAPDFDNIKSRFVEFLSTLNYTE